MNGHKHRGRGFRLQQFLRLSILIWSWSQNQNRGRPTHFCLIRRSSRCRHLFNKMLIKMPSRCTKLMKTELRENCREGEKENATLSTIMCMKTGRGDDETCNGGIFVLGLLSRTWLFQRTKTEKGIYCLTLMGQILVSPFHKLRFVCSRNNLMIKKNGSLKTFLFWENGFQNSYRNFNHAFFYSK